MDKLEENHPEWSNPDPERKICYVFVYMWMVAVKLMNKQLEFNYSSEVERKGLEGEVGISLEGGIEETMKDRGWEGGLDWGNQTGSRREEGAMEGIQGETAKAKGRLRAHMET